MKKIRIKLTPVGHYFFGGERNFTFGNGINRQMSESYYIASLKVPSQTTLFGTLRYLIGVKNESLKGNSEELIGKESYNLTKDNDDFGVIKSISPLYLFHEDGDGTKGKYYIRTPFDHKVKKKEENDKTPVLYNPLKPEDDSGIKVINYPSKDCSGISKRYPHDFISKDGISYSYTCIEDQTLIDEGTIFKSSVEVVSKKNKKDNKDCFVKKEYYRLEKGWSFMFFAELDSDEIPEWNRSAVIGKDSSVFSVSITEDKEPDIKALFKDREKGFKYCQSPVFVKGRVSEVLDKSSFSILESEYFRSFMSEGSRLKPNGTELLQLISAGSILYTDDISDLNNAHAKIAGFNIIIDGGKE